MCNLIAPMDTIKASIHIGLWEGQIDPKEVKCDGTLLLVKQNSCQDVPICEDRV
jgi:hypothetical protein